MVGAALSTYGFAAARRRAAARALESTVLGALAADDLGGASVADGVARIRPLVARAAREPIMSAAAHPRTPPYMADVLAAYLVERWGAAVLERDAARHRTARDKWRRMLALRLLFRLDHGQAIALLARALDEPDADVASVALTLLGGSTDPAAAAILIS